jgi:hypothetical protein
VTSPSDYVVNVSSVQDFMQCRFRWLCKWVENRVPLRDARPLRFGKLLHALYEAHLREGLPMERALARTQMIWGVHLRDATTEEDREDAKEALDDLAQMWEPMLLWKDRYKFDLPLLEVEEPFMIRPFPDQSIVMRGRPDRAGVYDGKVYHVQNRSLASGVNFPLYLELQQRSYHEHLYAEALDRKYGAANPDGFTFPDGQHMEHGLPYGGTFFNLYRKLKYRKKPTKKQEAAGEPGDILNPVESIFWQHPMGIDLKSELHGHVMESLNRHIDEMRKVEQKYRDYGIVPAPNEKLNGGPYGNRLDEYYRVLTGRISLHDNEHFKDREDTYAPATEE